MYEPQEPEAQVISTSQAINLTSTLAAMSLPAGVFLLFADQRSRAVHRYAIQSVGLGVAVVAAWMILWLLAAILGYIPFIGYGFYILAWVAGVLIAIADGVLRVRMMLRAYRGEAYALPWIGEQLRKFE